MRYTDEPFPEAAKKLLQTAGPLGPDGRPMPMRQRELERTMGLEPSGSLFTRDTTPSMEAMRRAATALGVPPAFFAEYRLEWVRERLNHRAGGTGRRYSREKRLQQALEWYRRLGLEEATARLVAREWERELDLEETERVREEVRRYREDTIRRQTAARRQTLAERHREEVTGRAPAEGDELTADELIEDAERRRHAGGGSGP